MNARPAAAAAEMVAVCAETTLTREHVGFGWGDPVDASKPDVWLCSGHACEYSPDYPGRISLWTAYGLEGFANTNAERDKRNAAVFKARNYGFATRTPIPRGSRFD